MPGQANPRLKVVVVAPAESAGGMDQPAHSAGERVDRLGIEIRFLTILRAKRALIRVSNAEIQRQSRRELPVILKIEGVGSRAGVPVCQRLSELGLAHITQKESGKGVARARHWLSVGLHVGGHEVKSEVAAGVVQRERVEPIPQ